MCQINIDFAGAIIKTAIGLAKKNFELYGKEPVIEKLFVSIGKFRFHEATNLRECIQFVADKEFEDFFAPGWLLIFEIKRNLVCEDCGDIFEPEQDKIAFLQLRFKTVCPKCGKFVGAAELYEICARIPFVKIY